MLYDLEKMVGIFILAVLFPIIVVGITFPIHTAIFGSNNGAHKGYITAYEKSGVFFKTYSMYIKTDLSSSQEDKYCFEDISLIPLIEEVIENKEPVKVSFENGTHVSGLRCAMGDASIVTKITK